MLFKNICQYLAYLHNSVNKHFLNDCNVTSQMDRDAVKGQGRSMDCNITKYNKLIDLVSHSICI